MIVKLQQKYKIKLKPSTASALKGFSIGAVFVVVKVGNNVVFLYPDGKSNTIVSVSADKFYENFEILDEFIDNFDYAMDAII